MRQKLLEIFRSEHAEHVEQIRSIVSLLENVQGATLRPELTEAFRRAHSLKGAARAVDLRAIEGIAHRVETVLSRVRDGSLPLDHRTAEIIQQALDCSEDGLATPSMNEIPPGWLELGPAIDDLLGVTPTSAAVPTEPEPPDAREEVSQSSPHAVVETVRVAAENLDRLLGASGLIMAEAARQDETVRRLAALGRAAEELQKEVGGSLARRTGGARCAERSLTERLETASAGLRALTNDIRDLAATHSQSTWTLRRQAEQLQEDVWRARVLPIESLFEGFGKMVRDLARDEGKKIQLLISGREVHADRLVLQALKDPVIHLVRNAVAHGIEAPAARMAKGKSAEGVISLAIATDGRQLTLTVEDDGSGIDVEVISRVAIETGFLAREQAGSLSAEDLLRLVLQPGFSTASEVTELSGRGIGLSVVHEAARRLQGDVSLGHSPAGGLRVVISAPLSLAATHLLLVYCSGQVFAIPTHNIANLRRVRIDDVESVQGRPVITVDGRQMPLYQLSALINLPNGKLKAGSAYLPVVVLKSGGRMAAVTVDALGEEHRANIQDCGAPMPRFVAGAVILNNGAVSTVLNPAGLIELCSRAGPRPLNDPAPAEPKPAASILIVDDSITTRSLEKGILEAYGYRVRVAVDGLQALELLRSERSDLVLSDIEMPGLDGFGLLETIKADKNLRDIPVILVSSIDDAVYMKRGLDLGAGAYIVKRKFDQRELLRTIRQML